MTVIRRFDADVESIKRTAPGTFEIRARTSDKAPGVAASIFFEMGIIGEAPLIGEGILITVENLRDKATSKD